MSSTVSQSKARPRGATLLPALWWTTVMAMIAGLGSAGLVGGFAGLVRLTAQNWVGGSVVLVASALAVVGACCLARYRDDLLDGMSE